MSKSTLTALAVAAAICAVDRAFDARTDVHHLDIRNEPLDDIVVSAQEEPLWTREIAQTPVLHFNPGSPEQVAAIRAERARRKAEAFAKRQPK